MWTTTTLAFGTPYRPPPPGTMALSRGALSPCPRPPIPVDRIPERLPPFTRGAVHADADGHLWIRTLPQPAPYDAMIYDIVDRNGALIDRVRVPSDKRIVGFGPNGTVFLAAGSSGSAQIERVRFR